MTNPLISIIVPVFNAEKFVGETLNSLVLQSYPNIEIILINDGSTDNSLEIINEFCSKDKRIQLFTIQNCGQAAASNFGLTKAIGHFIKFLDADDMLSPEHIEFQLKAVQKSQDHIASCEWGRFYDGNYLSAQFNPEPVWQNMDSMDWIKASLAQKSDMMGAWLWLIPRAILNKAGYWDERLSLNNDFDFSVRLLLASKGVKFAKDAKLYYRSGLSSSLSQTFSKKAVESAFLTTQLGCNHILTSENSELTRELCANRYQTWIYRIYPQYPDLISKFKLEVNNLGGSNIEMDGGKIFIVLRNIFGWKTAKRIQTFFYKMGWVLIAKMKNNWKIQTKILLL